jgi:hypothetical protein
MMMMIHIRSYSSELAAEMLEWMVFALGKCLQSPSGILVNVGMCEDVISGRLWAVKFQRRLEASKKLVREILELQGRLEGHADWTWDLFGLVTRFMYVHMYVICMYEHTMSIL